MYSISISLYSYRNKNLYGVVEDIVNKCSNQNNFIFKVIDQNNTFRGNITELSKKNIKIIYDYVVWDSIESPILYKKNFLDGVVSNYHLQISDRVRLPQNWDKYLTEICNESIVSGYGKRSFVIKNKFMLDKKIENSIGMTISDVIDRDLIFAKTKIFKLIGFPVNLKYYGEEESMSILARIQNINIVSLPSSMVVINGDSLDKKDYIPFSLYHNYNDMISLYKNNKSKLQEFGIMSSLYPLPYQSNDVSYDIRKSSIDKVGGDRYLNRTAMVD